MDGKHLTRNDEPLDTPTSTPAFERIPERFRGYTSGDEPEPIYDPEFCSCGQYLDFDTAYTPDQYIVDMEQWAEFAEHYPSPVYLFRTAVSLMPGEG